MRVPHVKPALGLIAGLLVGASLVLVGRATVDTTSRPGTTRSDDYFAGLRAGEAQGRQEGRALQEGSSLPAGSRRPVTDAFNAGYVAGSNDAFAGYDGGWSVSVPYVVTLEKGTGQIVYRIGSRTSIEPNVNYYLCANGRDICHDRRR